MSVLPPPRGAGARFPGSRATVLAALSARCLLGWREPAAPEPACPFAGPVPGALRGQPAGRGGEGAAPGGGLGRRGRAAGLPVAAARPAPAAAVREREEHHRAGAAAGAGGAEAKGGAPRGRGRARAGPSRREGLGGGAGGHPLCSHGPPPQAIHMETDPQTISAYLVYLSQHTPVEEQGQHSDLALVRGWGWGSLWATRRQGHTLALGPECELPWQRPSVQSRSRGQERPVSLGLWAREVWFGRPGRWRGQVHASCSCGPVSRARACVLPRPALSWPSFS